jgi:hypothetical protein
VTFCCAATAGPNQWFLSAVALVCIAILCLPLEGEKSAISWTVTVNVKLVVSYVLGRIVTAPELGHYMREVWMNVICCFPGTVYTVTFISPLSRVSLTRTSVNRTMTEFTKIPGLWEELK